MKVKLKSQKELRELGFELIPQKSHPDLGGNYMTIIKDPESRSATGITLDLDICNELEVVPKASINQEIYEVFKWAFEPLD